MEQSSALESGCRLSQPNLSWEPELSDLKLFRITNGSAQELKGKSVALEVSLQRLIEANMETLFGVRFLATEYSTGAKHRGRIDSLGLDETGSPVIFEYFSFKHFNLL